MDRSDLTELLDRCYDLVMQPVTITPGTSAREFVIDNLTIDKWSWNGGVELVLTIDIEEIVLVADIMDEKEGCRPDWHCRRPPQIFDPEKCEQLLEMLRRRYILDDLSKI